MTVLKEPDARPAGDRLQAAGDAAERQMAFYLRRAFGDNPDVMVINDLRLVEGDDAAQIDHLILHAAGAIVIESKSVTQKVKVNTRGEWARLWDGNWQGMRSPIIQAEQQADFLRKFLGKRARSLRDGAGRDAGFAGFPMVVLVGVSDSGIIERDADDVAPEVFKADQIPAQATKAITAQQTEETLAAPELERVTRYLLKAHTPRVAPGTAKTAKPRRAAPPAAPEKPAKPAQPEKVVTEAKPAKVRKDPWGFLKKVAALPPPLTPTPAPKPAPAPAPAPAPKAACKKCGGAELTIQYDKFGYYWKCPCGGNTAIDLTAPDGGKGKLRKQGARFFLCYGDGQEVLFHTNAKEDAATG